MRSLGRSGERSDAATAYLRRRLTVKLRGRTEAPDQSRGCTLSSRTRGDTTELHGPLQRLLDATARPQPINYRFCLGKSEPRFNSIRFDCRDFPARVIS